MSTVDLGYFSKEAMPYGRIFASEAFLRRGILFLAAALSVLITASIVYILVYESILFFRQVSIIDFLTDTEWTPVFDNPRFGIMTLVSGTLMTTFIGLIVAVPAGTILAIYLSEFARQRVREAIKPILELLAGVPTAEKADKGVAGSGTELGNVIGVIHTPDDRPAGGIEVALFRARLHPPANRARRGHPGRVFRGNGCIPSWNVARRRRDHGRCDRRWPASTACL